jgi:hypothetical protein
MPDTGHGMAPGDLDCLVEIRAVERVEADDELLSLGEGPASANVDAGRVARGRDDRRRTPRVGDRATDRGVSNVR